MSNQPQPTFKPRFDYAHMMQQVYQANGEWVELPIDQLAGDTLKEKQGAVTRAGATRKLNGQTTTYEGHLYRPPARLPISKLVFKVQLYFVSGVSFHVTR